MARTETAKAYHHGDLRNALLTVALERLGLEGADALNLRKLAARVGVSHAAVYRHFADKQALVQDPSSPFFTTPHFDGHRSVLVRASRLGELSRDELVEVVQDAWLSQASHRRRTTWLAEHGVEGGVEG